MNKNHIDYCLIGELAVNSYVDPVVSMDIDIVITSNNIDALIRLLPDGFSTKIFPYSFNMYHPQSDLRLQIQTDQCYQEFISRASMLIVMD